MAASSRLMIAEAKRRFPARIRIAVPPQGFGQQLDHMTACSTPIAAPAIGR